MFGAGAPCALQSMVASFPSRAVKFWGGFTITGDDATKNWDVIIVIKKGHSISVTKILHYAVYVIEKIFEKYQEWFRKLNII